MMTEKKREITQAAFEMALQQLAEVSAMAFSLQYDLEPLSPEDIQAGAEPLSQGQIQESLDRIQSIITVVAMNDLGASREEWYAAQGKIQ